MGKKKPQKTKEISVAIAEASTAGDGTQKEEQALLQTPRKRGRPRKVIEKIAGSEETVEEAVESQSKKAKTGEVEEKTQVENKEKAGEKEFPRRSSRRKSKPRKSS